MTVMTHRPEDFEAIVLDADELRAHPSLKALHSMINDAFWAQHREIIGNEPRFRDAEEFVGSMGIHGRCCIMFKKKKDQGHQPSNGNGIAQNGDLGLDEYTPVATATLKPFKEHIPGLPVNDENGDANANANGNGNQTQPQDTEKNEPLDLLSILDWEPSVVAVRPEPGFQGLGLATRCMEMVERDVLMRMDQAELGAPGAGIGADGDKRNDLRFLIRTSAGVNVSYWERRGYIPVSTTVYPKGTWNMAQEFSLITLRKVVPRLGNKVN